MFCEAPYCAICKRCRAKNGTCGLQQVKFKKQYLIIWPLEEKSKKSGIYFSKHHQISSLGLSCGLLLTVVG